MGSVLVSDIATDVARYPHSMMVDDRSEQAGQHASHYTNHSSGASSSEAPAHHNPSRRPAAEDTPPVGRRHPTQGAPAAVAEGAGQEARYESAGSGGNSSSPPSPQLLPTLRSSLSLTASGSGSPARIKVRDLNHIQAFASEEVLTRSQHGSRPSLRGRVDGGQQYEISSMPVTDIIEMVAGLLTKITTTNDRQHQHENFHRHLPSPEGSSALNQQTASVLSFHGKNVPSITILSYLSRIHKYCPTTYEVFLSLLVYFDRMTETINNGTLRSFRSVEEAFGGGNGTASTDARADVEPPTSSDSAASLVDSDDESSAKPGNLFVVDSFNIHRLVIAGVTCASKFFSDVFYTNSRYAKVGGLPIHELNHLELQFLLLNDFKLSVPVEELEAYGSMLVEFYAQEVVAQQLNNNSNNAGAANDALYMQSSAQ